jgi:hypothetical protein
MYNETNSIMEQLRYVADVYDCGTYGSGGYNNGACATTTDPLSGALSYTGSALWVPVAIAIVIIAVAIAVMVFRKRRNRK